MPLFTLCASTGVILLVWGSFPGLGASSSFQTLFTPHVASALRNTHTALWGPPCGFIPLDTFGCFFSHHIKQIQDNQLLVVKFKMGISKASLVSCKLWVEDSSSCSHSHLLHNKGEWLLCSLGQTFKNLAQPAPYKRLIFTAGRKEFYSFLFAVPCSSSPLNGGPSLAPGKVTFECWSPSVIWRAIFTARKGWVWPPRLWCCF